MRRLALLGPLCLLAAPAFAGPTEEAMAHAKAFERAINARDVKAVVALYAADAHVIWPGQGEEASGIAAIEKLATAFVAGLPESAEIHLDAQTVIPLGDGHVATVGRWTQSVTDADGKRQTAEIRTSEVLETKQGKTLYLVDHASIGLPAPAARPGM